MPTVRIELEHMRHQLVRALSQHAELFAESFDKAIQDLDTDAMIANIVREEAPRIIHATITTGIESQVKSIVYDAMREQGFYGDFAFETRKKIQQAIIDAFVEKLQKPTETN